MPARVVVTGIGLMTPLGSSPEELWQRLSRGETATRPFPENLRREWGLNLESWCPVENFSPPEKYREADRQIQFAVAASQAALHNAGLDFSKPNLRMSVYLSSSKGGISTLLKAHAALLQNGPRAVPATFFQNFCASSPASIVAQTFGATEAGLNLVSACASGAHSIMMGARRLIQEPDQIILAGSTEASLNPLILAGFSQMGVLGDRCRPFDRRRCGFVPGEGSAVLVLESLSRARERGAPILAEWVGAASVADATDAVHFDPSGESIARAIRLAAQNAGIGVEEIDYVNLHATGTRENDWLETRAVKQVWPGKRKPALSGTKPATGHLLGASGALEAAIAVLALKNQFVPPTLNLEEPDPECDLDYTAQRGRAIKMRTALSLSYGFGGQIAALIFRKLS